MANIVSDQFFKSLLKTVYLSGVENSKYQNSPVLSAIGKERFAGKEMKYAAQYGNGGNFGSVYNTIANNRTSGARNLEWTMEPGYLFGLFNINQPEMLSSAEERGAYMKILSNKMAACFDGISKTLAAYMYGGKQGGLGEAADALSAVALTGNKLKVTSSTAIKMDVGTRFVMPSVDGVVMTVTAIDDDVITFSASAASSSGIAKGDKINLYTAFGSDGTFRGIEGLEDLIPSVGNRTGSDWETYISTQFRGVDRSIAVNRLAGQFAKAAASGDTRLSDTLVSLLKKTKRAGGLNNMVIINDETWDAVGAELGIQRNLWQATDGAVSKQGITLGVNELATAFGDAFIGRTVIDPYCPNGKAYMIEKDDFKFYDLGNVGKVIEPVGNDQLGKKDIESVGDQGFGNEVASSINIDKLFTVVPDSNGEYGPEYTIAANLFGSFAIRKTASSGVAVLA